MKLYLLFLLLLFSNLMPSLSWGQDEPKRAQPVVPVRAKPQDIWVKKNEESRLTQLFSANGALWGVNSNYEVFRWETNQWARRNAGSKLKEILDLGDDTWGISPTNQAYRWKGNAWTLSSGNLKFKQLVQAETYIWGLGLDDRIFQWDGNSWKEPDPNSRLKQLEVAYVNGARQLWGINAENNVYLREDKDWKQKNPGSKLKTIVGGWDLLGISPSNRGYVWKNNNWVTLSPAIELKDFYFTTGSGDWAISQSNEVFQVSGGNTLVRKNAGSKLTKIFALGQKDVWGISPSGVPYFWKSNDWKPYELPDDNHAVQLIHFNFRVWAIDEKDQVWMLPSITVTPPEN